jgi:NitT/TauT family transport system ATP-binding protein
MGNMNRDLLKVTNLSKHFTDAGGFRYPVLNNISFTIPGENNEGVVYTIAAPFGSGKTTLLKIISGLIKQSSGEILYKGEPLNFKLPYIPSKPSSFPWMSVLENVKFSAALNSNVTLKAEDYISLAGLEGYESHLPHNKSGGFRFRIALARGLAAGKNLILIDDSFEAVKDESIDAVYLLIRNLKKKGFSFLIATPDITGASAVSDKIIILGKAPSSIIKEFSINRNLIESGNRLNYTEAAKTRDEIELFIKENNISQKLNFII